MDAPQPESSIYHCTQHEPVVLSPIPPAEQENELLKKQLFDLQKTTEDRFNTIAILLQELQKVKK